ncbi:MAG: EI24 domain-containing protein [Janthinobacterium lividum]
MFQPLLRAVAQLDDPVFLGAVLRSLALSLLLFLAILGAVVWGVQALVTAPGWPAWLGWLAAILGGVGTAFLSVYLFVPAALLVATLYMDRIADAVDQRFYPGLPRPQGAALTVQAWDGAVLGLQVLALQVVALVLLVALPGVGLVLGWIITGWAIGRGLFVGVAMRRMSRQEALALYDSRRFIVLAQGAALAAASVVPVLNLFVPVLGTAAMVHVLQRQRGGWAARLL